MSRNYKRDSKGRFARLGRAIKSKLKRKTPEQKVAQLRKKRADRLKRRGYSKVSTSTYRGDSRGRTRADGKYEFQVTTYQKATQGKRLKR
jgi:hypothetical protein